MKNIFNTFSQEEQLAILNFFIDTNISLQLDFNPEGIEYLKGINSKNRGLLFDNPEKPELLCQILQVKNRIIQAVRTKYYDQYVGYVPFPLGEHSKPIELSFPIHFLQNATILKE